MLPSLDIYFFCKIKFMGVPLVNTTMWVSDLSSYYTSLACCTCVPLPEPELPLSIEPRELRSPLASERPWRLRAVGVGSLREPELCWPHGERPGAGSVPALFVSRGLLSRVFLAQPAAVSLTLIWTHACVWQSRHFPSGAATGKWLKEAALTCCETWGCR